MKTIVYKVSYEKMISRLPGLFAYLDANDFGEMELHYATDSLSGCYGKIVENIKLPNGISLEVDGHRILQGGVTYSFRTIIDYYYKYKQKLNDNNSFKVFIEKGIGKITVDRSINGKAVPKFIYLSNARSLYNKLVKLSKQCTFYETHREEYGNDKHLCCLCERYTEMGGDKFKEFVEKQVPLAEERAKEYYGYAANGNNAMTLDFDVDLTSSFEDLGIMTPFVGEWIPYKKYYIGDKVFYDGDVYVANNATTGKWNEDTEKVTFDYDNFTLVDSGIERIRIVQNETSPIGDFNINGYTDSKLQDLRRSVTYLNDSDIEEKPEEGRDWLFYYRIGLIVNHKIINNSIGNITTLDGGNYVFKNGYCMNLMAYGDVIENISVNQGNQTISFIYREGVHLMASLAETIIDDDGNSIYKWNTFEWDKDENIGIKYQETYSYTSDSELYNLTTDSKPATEEDKTKKWIIIDSDYQSVRGVIKNGAIIYPSDAVEKYDFDKYINGEYDDILRFCKFEFVTYNNTLSYNKMIANQNAVIVSNLTDFDIHRTDFNEFMNSGLIRNEYFNGITYAPTKNIDVKIERGSTAAFQKHISFSQVKTLEDLENFQNSSFFKLSEG